MAVSTREERRALAFQQCGQCSYDFLTGEGTRSCHYYECPYLPEVLDVRCPTCLYNFHTREGQPGCGDTPSCEFARHEARQHLHAARHWQHQHA